MIPDAAAVLYGTGIVEEHPLLTIQEWLQREKDRERFSWDMEEAKRRWCYRPPVNAAAYGIDNRSSELPDVIWGPGPGGQAARKLARLALLMYGGGI